MSDWLELVLWNTTQYLKKNCSSHMVTLKMLKSNKFLFNPSSCVFFTKNMNEQGVGAKHLVYICLILD